MKKGIATSALLSILFFLLLMLACKKEDAVAPPERKPPIARASSDTTVYLPFTSAEMSASASTDPQTRIILYQWKQLDGPVTVELVNDLQEKAYVMGLVQAGAYVFELTVKNTFNLAAKDTLTITVAEPNCTGTTQEVVLKDQSWSYAWDMAMYFEGFLSCLPAGGYLKNIYIKRDGAADWELVVPEGNYTTGTNPGHIWMYTSGTLAILPNINLDADTPDVKIAYCK